MYSGLFLSCDTELSEYCIVESFDASCSSGDVIIMTQAHFGQMRVGRCIEEDLGYIGCSGDVIDLLDAQCSGRESCSVPVSNSAMIAKSSCRKSLLQYLEADYECRPGESRVSTVLLRHLRRVRYECNLATCTCTRWFKKHPTVIYSLYCAHSPSG